jgi:hypothetical protein
MSDPERKYFGLTKKRIITTNTIRNTNSNNSNIINNIFDLSI